MSSEINYGVEVVTSLITEFKKNNNIWLSKMNSEDNEVTLFKLKIINDTSTLAIFQKSSLQCLTELTVKVNTNSIDHLLRTIATSFDSKSHSFLQFLKYLSILTFMLPNFF